MASRPGRSRSPTTSSRCGTSTPTGRAAFAGEVAGNWLWLVMWPDTAGMMMVEPLELRDLRDPGQEMDLPFGARSPQLPG